MYKNILKSWAIGMLAVYLILALNLIPQRMRIGWLTRPIVLPVPVQGVPMNEAYLPVIARYLALTGLGVMLGGFLLGLPAFFFLDRRRRAARRRTLENTNR